MNRFATIAAAMLALAAPAAAQVAPAPRDGRAVAEDVRKVLAENYVVVERRAALDRALAGAIAAGRYDGVDPAELAQRMTQDLYAVAQDRHLSLSYDPRGAPLPGTNSGDRAAEEAAFAEYARRENHGVRALTVLPGNVRVLDYTGFIWTGPESAAALDDAMRFLRGGDAAIIDLRGNGGGSPDAVRHLASYFVPPNTPLVTFHMRGDPPVVSSTGAEPPASGMWPTGKPVYVLTGDRTASAAEEFASHVAGFRFATLIGETTRGAAYRNEFFLIAGGFQLSVSVGRPVLPGGGDWEGRGVTPGIAVPVDLAQTRALQEAYAALAASASADRRTDYEWLSQAQAARIAPASLARAADAYAGRYGVRVISVEAGRLMYRRDGGITSALLAVGPDLFALEADPLTRVRFVTEGESVTAFKLLGPEGVRATAPRTFLE